jgi:putative Ca2+/H+ antiporter (TMEM165/GDT1 family)
MVQAVPCLARPLTTLSPEGWGEAWSRFLSGLERKNVEAFLVSAGVVALAEIGDKTQLLAFILAAKFRQPVPIVLGILVATLLNHAFAAAIGSWIITQLGPETLNWTLGLLFVGMAIWTLIPDQLDEAQSGTGGDGAGVFSATLLVFFLAEMGDKTQIATAALAAQYQMFSAVVAGTTLGMMIANVPAVYLGERLANRIPAHLVRGIAAAVFALIGIAVLLEASKNLAL